MLKHVPSWKLIVLACGFLLMIYSAIEYISSVKTSNDANLKRALSTSLKHQDDTTGEIKAAVANLDKEVHGLKAVIKTKIPTARGKK